MGQDRRVSQNVKLMLRFKPAENLPSSEELWATPVEAGEDGGSYRLANSSYMVPLATGDVVRAEHNRDGVLQVTGLVGPSPMIMTVLAAPPGSAMNLEPVVAVWSKSGAYWTEGRSGMLVTVWAEWIDVATITEVVQPAVDAGVEWLATAPPEVRVADNMTEVDFELAGGRSDGVS